MSGYRKTANQFHPIPTRKASYMWLAGANDHLKKHKVA
jgi:hypothetical protein